MLWRCVAVVNVRADPRLDAKVASRGAKPTASSLCLGWQRHVRRRITQLVVLGLTAVARNARDAYRSYHHDEHVTDHVWVGVNNWATLIDANARAVGG